MPSSKRVLNFATQPRQLLDGSEKPSFSAHAAKDATGKLTVSVILRRKTRLNPSLLGRNRVTRTQYNATYTASSADIAQVRKFAKEFGLTIADSLTQRQTVLLTGTVAAMQKAFCVSLRQATLDGSTYRVRDGVRREHRRLLRTQHGSGIHRRHLHCRP